ncbi:MAG: hypothetical protein LBH69_02820 [Methanomassiliicoccaceae archaeon]|jgi:hypothetical protein|nr:hypothetical protein [Methanomassiliicoccaceae archaeon]
MSNALFITEGSRAEPRFLESLWRRYRKDGIEIYSYKTNIHVLMGEIFDGDDIDEDLDLLHHLLSRENDPQEKEKLQRRFTDIFLVFDMDMHDERASIFRLEKMLKFFNDSANDGKLYINYPMLESFRHLRSMDDPDFKERCAAVSQFSDYKRIVGNECHIPLRDVKSYSSEIFEALIAMHLKKANYILNGKFELPSVEEFGSWEGIDILKEQDRRMKEDGYVFVLNTSLFSVVDYCPGRFLETDRM